MRPADSVLATLPVAVLHPGDVVCVERGTAVETLLGSCVALVLADRRRTVAAVAHVVHPGRPAPGAPQTTAHGEVALEAMLRALRAHGMNPRLCEAGLAGGGNMFPGIFPGLHVGERNVAWALAALQREGIALGWQDTGGLGHRRLQWTVGAGWPAVESVPL